jgi:hypothetical protein
MGGQHLGHDTPQRAVALRIIGIVGIRKTALGNGLQPLNPIEPLRAANMGLRISGCGMRLRNLG